MSCFGQWIKQVSNPIIAPKQTLAIWLLSW